MVLFVILLLFNIAGEERVEVKKFTLKSAESTKIKKKRVGVLISGSGEFIFLLHRF